MKTLTDPTATVLAGNIGFFWSQASHSAIKLAEDARLRGYLHQTDNSLVEVRALDENDDLGDFFGSQPKPAAVAVFGVTEGTGLLVPEILGVGSTMQFGGSRASVLRYRARSLVTGVNVESAKSSRLKSASLTFQEGLTFANLSALSETHRVDPATMLMKEVTFTLKSIDNPLSGGKYGSFSLEFEPDWSTSGKGTQRVLNSGLAITLSATRPRPYADFRPLLLGLQDLLNIAYDRFVQAEVGRAVVHGCEDESRAHLWMDEAMTIPPHATRSEGKREVRPLFSLDDIGGPDGLRRWLSLRDRFPDAALVVASGFRSGGARQPARLLEVAAAIEYYVNVNRVNGAGWAEKKSAPSHSEALANHVGASFERLVGNNAKWATRFLATYNGVKHNPSFRRDPDEIEILSWSGQILLLAALMNRCSLSKTPSRKIFGDYRLEGGATRLRSILGT